MPESISELLSFLMIKIDCFEFLTNFSNCVLFKRLNKTTLVKGQNKREQRSFLQFFDPSKKAKANFIKAPSFFPQTKKVDISSHCSTSALFRNKRFMFDEMTYRNASKFAIFLGYENPGSFSLFILCYFIFFPNECPGLCRHRPGHS